MKSMNDKEVSDFAWNKLFGDLDDIESKTMFPEEKDMPKEMHGVSIEIKPLMAGEQTQAAPEVMKADDEDDELGKLGL